MELKRLLNRVIDLCAQGQLEGAETVAEYALAEADRLLKDLMAYHSQTDFMRSQMAAMAAEIEDMQKEINSLKGDSMNDLLNEELRELEIDTAREVFDCAGDSITTMLVIRGTR